MLGCKDTTASENLEKGDILKELSKKTETGWSTSLKWEKLMFIEFPLGASMIQLQFTSSGSSLGKLGDSITPLKPVIVLLQSE